MSLERASVGFTDELLPEGKVALADARAALAEVKAAAQVGQTLFSGLRSPAQSALASLRGTLDELRSFARQLRLAPDSLIFGVARPASPAGGER
jgi:hypothetical protein